MAEAMCVDPTSAKTAIWNVYKKNKDVFTSASMAHTLTQSGDIRLIFKVI